MSKELVIKDNDDMSYLTIESNWGNEWRDAKGKESPFYVTLEDTFFGSETSISLEIEQAKELVSFLQGKIKYLEGNGLDRLVEAKREMKDMDDFETLDVYEKEIYVEFDSQRLYDEMGHNRFQELIKNMISADMNIRANTPFRLVGIQKHKLPNREPMYDLVFIDGNREHKMKESLLSIV